MRRGGSRPISPSCRCWLDARLAAVQQSRQALQETRRLCPFPITRATVMGRLGRSGKWSDKSPVQPTQYMPVRGLPTLSSIKQMNRFRSRKSKLNGTPLPAAVVHTCSPTRRRCFPAFRRRCLCDLDFDAFDSAALCARSTAECRQVKGGRAKRYSGQDSLRLWIIRAISRPSGDFRSISLRIFSSTTYSGPSFLDRKSTRLNSSHLGISYAVFCL